MEAMEQVQEALCRAKGEHEDLAVWLDLNGELVGVQSRAKARLPLASMVHDNAAISQRLDEGLPQLTFAHLEVEAEAFASLVKEIMAILARHSTGWQGAEMEERSSEALVSLAEEVFASAIPPTKAGGSGSTLTPLAIEYALVPYAERAAESLRFRLDLGRWQRGHCPLCGAAPGFAFLSQEAGARNLICCRCNSQWPYPRLRCPFCERTGQRDLQYYPSADGVYRLYVCNLCKHYLKTIDLRKVERDVCLSAEPILTVAMDLAAQDRGYMA